MDTQYMEILERLKTRHLLTLSAVGSLARTSALLEKAQELRVAGRDYGGRCTELSEMSDPITPLSKIALNSENEDSSMSYMDFPKSGMMHNGNVYRVASLECSSAGKEYISLPTPRVSSANGSPRNRYFGSPTYRGELGGIYPGWRDRWSLPEPRTFRSTHGVPNLVDRNRCIGNAVQPLMAQYLFECIRCFDE